MLCFEASHVLSALQEVRCSLMSKNYVVRRVSKEMDTPGEGLPHDRGGGGARNGRAGADHSHNHVYNIGIVNILPRSNYCI